jgi:hypothetical protein
MLVPSGSGPTWLVSPIHAKRWSGWGLRGHQIWAPWSPIRPGVEGASPHVICSSAERLFGAGRAVEPAVWAREVLIAHERYSVNLTSS